MMLTELLAELRALDVRLYVEDGALKCKAPKNALSDELKASLKLRKNDLIAVLTQPGSDHTASITPAARTAPIPLSYAQQRLWFLEQLAPGNAFYNVPLALRLDGALNTAALAQSLNEIVRRHESLRTRFVGSNGRAEQIVDEHLKVPLIYTDLTGLPEPARSAAAADLGRLEAGTPFNLSTGPLLRALLVVLSNEAGRHTHILLLTLHHIVSDGWSAELLTRELIALYHAIDVGKASPLAELTIQYADFACWQRQWLSGEVWQRQMDYWQKQLHGAPPVLELPTDRARPPLMSYRGVDHAFTVAPELSGRMRALSRSREATLFMTLLAAFKVLLFRYSHGQDICVGTPIANRNRIELEDLIGFFVNTLVLRTDLSGDPPFATLLSRVKRTVLDAQNHQDLPFEQLVEVLQPERNMSHSPLFQVMFTLQNTVRHGMKLPGLEIGEVENAGCVAKFDLTLHIGEHESGALKGTIEYNTDLFEASTIARMAEHYLVLLQGIAERPDMRLSELPLLTPAERRQILADYNATAMAYPDACLIQQLFERQVATTPDAVAAVFAGESLSYRELNRKANRIAHRLLGLGVSPDDRVAICVERGLDMVAGLLGILKAGAAYVPLDPGYPNERLAYMLADSSPAALLTQSSLQDSLPHRELPPVVLLDAVMDGYSESNPDPVELGLTARNLAYVIYTSGSTGRPKGVMVEHRNVVNFLCSMVDAPGLDSSDVLLAITTLSFDIAGLELFLPLVNGAKIIIAGRAQAADPVFLQNTIEQAGITIMQATPATWRLLINGGWQGSKNLKALCGGEALTRELSAQLTGRVGELWNLYGPTETTVWSTCRLIHADHSGPCAYESIGRPIGNTQIYILDARLQPVPLGVSGEIYIGGAGVTLGYLNRPELTAERFAADPFSAETGARMYRTGDLARRLADGSIEYIGRNDFQVKIRGFRIELGEIEARLVACSGVRQAAVVVREDSPGDTRLAAYLVTEPGHEPAAADLRNQLAADLADYMIPSAFVSLSAFPLTPNGKLDRKSLPAPDYCGQKRYVPPRTATEEILAGIWAKVLSVEKIGIEDNFFELGGNSLLAVKLAYAVQSALGGNLDVAALFQAPTVETFARLLADETTIVSSPLVALKSSGTRPPLYCIDPGGYVFEYKGLAQAMDHRQPIYGIESRSLLLNPVRQYESFAEAAEYYARAILKQQPEGPYYLLGWSIGGAIALIIADLLEKRGHDVAFVGLLDTQIKVFAQTDEHADLLARYALYLNPAELEAFERIDAGAREEFRVFLATLPADEQLEQVVLWAAEQGCFDRNLPVSLIKLQFVVAENSLRLMNAHQWNIIKAPVYAWWAGGTLDEYGQPPEDWHLYSTGAVNCEEIGGSHMDILKSRALHKRIAEILNTIQASGRGLVA
jgi:amino acid adenylation domain-containing protein